MGMDEGRRFPPCGAVMMTLRAPTSYLMYLLLLSYRVTPVTSSSVAANTAVARACWTDIVLPSVRAAVSTTMTHCVNTSPMGKSNTSAGKRINTESELICL